MTFFVSLVSLVDHFSGEAAKEVIVAMGVFDEAGDGVGEIETQAAEGRAAMEGIDGMAEDESDTGGRQEIDGYELLAEYIVRIVFLR